MDKKLEAQMGTLTEYPVSKKKGKRCKSINFKKLSEGNRLILLIGLEDNKKVKRFVAKKNVRKISYSMIATEVQGDEAIENWQDFVYNTNRLFNQRVRSALKQGVAVVDKNFQNLETRIGFLESASLSGTVPAVLLVDKKLLKKDEYLQQQWKKDLLQVGVDKVYVI